MKEDIFINIGIEESLKQFLNNPDTDSYIGNSFYVVIIRILKLIYGEELIKAYQEFDSVKFMNILSKYGLSNSDAALFKEEVLKSYNFAKVHELDAIKAKDPYFLNILKALINMFVLKKNKGLTTYIDEDDFLDLCYINPHNPYRISYKFLMCDEVKEIEKYYYTKVNDFRETINLSETISEPLNLKALEYIGLSLDDLKNMNNEEASIAKNNAYNYFDVDSDSPDRDELLNNSLKNVNSKPLTTGNGYVDILLLMGIITTLFSTLAILIFCK